MSRFIKLLTNESEFLSSTDKLQINYHEVGIDRKQILDVSSYIAKDIFYLFTKLFTFHICVYLKQVKCIN